MENYQCDNCGKKYCSQSNLNRHIKNTKECNNLDGKENIIGIEEIKKIKDSNLKFYESLDNLKCLYCEKIFSKRSNVIKHINSNCKKYKIMNIQKNNENFEENSITIKDKEIEELKCMVKELLKQTSKINNIEFNSSNNSNNSITNTNSNNSITNTNSNNTINNQQNINLVAHGKENLDNISKKDYIKALGKGFNSIVMLTELIHFNKDRPENQNIFISNEKQKFAKQYDGNQWISVSKKKLIENLFYDKRDIVCEKMEEYSDDLSEPKINALNRMLYSKKEETDKIKVDIEMLLYNNRDVVKKTNQLK
jgi:hypothetical protein